MPIVPGSSHDLDFLNLEDGRCFEKDNIGGFTEHIASA